MKLTDTVVRNFLVAKIFRENTDRINSLDYSSNGETLISSSDDDSIIIYDCQNGTWVNDVGKLCISPIARSAAAAISQLLYIVKCVDYFMR